MNHSVGSPEDRARAAFQARIRAVSVPLHFEPHHGDALQKLRQAAGECMEKFVSALETLPHDHGRLIAALDSVAAAKDQAANAMLFHLKTKDEMK